jgi:hypothetical protein
MHLWLNDYEIKNPIRSNFGREGRAATAFGHSSGNPFSGDSWPYCPSCGTTIYRNIVPCQLHSNIANPPTLLARSSKGPGHPSWRSRHPIKVTSPHSPHGFEQTGLLDLHLHRITVLIRNEHSESVCTKRRRSLYDSCSTSSTSNSNTDIILRQPLHSLAGLPTGDRRHQSNPDNRCASSSLGAQKAGIRGPN